jgi:molecular chaperone HtpG
MADKQTLGFQTEVKQLMNLVVHSLYSNREIFIRELVSNASDALDKLRFLALSNGSLYEQDSDLKIVVTYDEANKTITIRDNGVGMSREEAMDHLGTIAKSGTKEFLNHLTGDQTKDSHLIGQFGVGFYSAFIVADKVTVKSRKAGAVADAGIIWESNGDGEYTIENVTQVSRGTEVTLHLKPEETEFLSDWRLKGIITKYSDHIAWPIEMLKPVAPKTDEDKAEGEEEKAKELTAPEFEKINKATALWTLSKSEITEEEYKAFYKHVGHDFQDPLAWLHNQVEGKQEYTSLLYIPSQAPFDLWHHDAKYGLKLYVKRVFIMDGAEQFLPRYLRFIKGIVDCNDLPLNVSREILQDNKLIETIKTASVKRILGFLEKLAQDDKEKYQQFWKAFGLVLKEGPIEDFANREKIAKLLRFSSTHETNEEPNVSFDDYIGRMKEGQDKIYYITASSFNAAKSSPHLEYFKKQGIEVLLLSDRVDEWLVGHLSEVEGKKLQSVTKGKLDSDKKEDATEDSKTEEASKQEEEKYTSLLTQLKKVLESKVKDVRLTDRLTDSPACIVADENDMDLEMQRILKMSGQNVPKTQPILEINPEHPLIEKLNSETDDERLKDWACLLLDQSILAEGGALDEPAVFVAKMNQMFLKS